MMADVSAPLMPKATRLVAVLITSKLMKPSLSQLGASPLERASKKANMSIA
jgi:hypothetical protein